MTKRTCQFPKHTCLREINFLKIAGISLLLFCTTSQIAVADSYEKNAVTATQQSKTEKITGKIVDESGEAIIGASVKVQGSTIGTITNMEGEFMIPNVPNKAVLEISYIGYKPLEVAVGKSKDLRITMEEDTKTLDEVIVVGYGTTSKRKTTAAIASVFGYRLKKKKHPPPLPVSIQKTLSKHRRQTSPKAWQDVLPVCWSQPAEAV